jgi:hypothetical protein
MEQSERDPNLDDRCPLCERSLAEDPHVPDYCDACGCLLVDASPRDGGDALPPGVTRPGEPLPTEGDAHDPTGPPRRRPGSTSSSRTASSSSRPRRYPPRCS